MSTTVAGAHPERGLAARWLTGLGLALVWFVLAVLSFWAMAALYIDVRTARTEDTADDFVRRDPRRDFGQVQTAHSSGAVMFRMFLPGACLVVEPETDKYWRLAGRRG